jgi:site-specific DNA recombinase
MPGGIGPTGELFGDWWARQDITGRNVWLRSMSVRLTFDREKFYLDLGDLFELTQQMNARGPVADWQQILTAMRDNDIAGMEMAGDIITYTHRSGATYTEAVDQYLEALTPEQEAQAAEFYGWPDQPEVAPPD